jgi:hypothetical protein
MRVLVVQESDWTEVGPHQSHYLVERLPAKAMGSAGGSGIQVAATGSLVGQGFEKTEKVYFMINEA